MSSELGLLYELALISVLAGGLYWGWFFTSRRPHGTATYGLMLIGCGALAGLGVIAHRYEMPSWMGVAGAIGLGAGMCLLIVGPLVRAMARRLAASERFDAAAKLLSIADVLAPGSGVGEEQALLGAMREIRDGKIEPTVDALTAAKERAPADAKLAIDERIAMLYLAAYRWEDAIAHAEENLFGAVPPAQEPPAGPLALRRALGIAPPVFVELLGAYGRKGDLDQAARMLARLEEVCDGRDDAALWLHRARLMFLALAGRVDAVQSLVAPRHARHMNPAARTYWIGVAHERRGEAKAAEAAYTKARSRSRGRPREMIDQALANLMNVKPAELSPIATEVIARVEAAPVPAVTERLRPRGPWGTRIVTMSVATVALVVVLVFGHSNDIGVLLRSGATVRQIVHAGEWWRLVSTIFIHVGAVHLVLNLIGLFFVARLAEEIFGAWRMLAIFALSGLVGSVATFLASPSGVSAGASGAIFGLLGAIFVELTLHKRRHRAAWNRGVWGAVVVAVGQLGLGFLYPMMDQWAHGGGLAAGALVGALLSPNASWAKLGHHLARAITLAFGALAVFAAVMIARTSITDSLTRAPLKQFTLAGVSVEAPSTWVDGTAQLFEPDLFILLSVKRQPPGDSRVEHVAMLLQGEPGRANGLGFDRTAVAEEHIIPLPPGWEGSELAISQVDPLGSRQRYRAVIAGLQTPEDTILVTLYVPETIGREASQLFTKLLASIH